MLHVVTPSGDTITDLSHPNRIYTAVADGWIAYQQVSGTPSDTCRVIRFLRQTDSGFTDVPGPEACGWAVTGIYGTAAVTVVGWAGGEELLKGFENWLRLCCTPAQADSRGAPSSKPSALRRVAPDDRGPGEEGSSEEGDLG